MAQHVAEMLGAGHEADLGDVRRAGLVEMQEQRDGDAGDQTRLHADAERGQQRDRDGREVRPRVAPCAAQYAQIDER